MDSKEVPIKIILNEKVLIRFYDELRSGFISYFRMKYRLDPDTISDIYQETFYIVFKKMKHDQLSELRCTLKTFIYSIGSNLLLNEMRKDKKLTGNIEDLLKSEISDDVDILEEEEYMKRISLITESIELLGEMCRSIIKMFYWQKMKLPEILFKLPGNQSLDALKTQKYRCMRTLEEILKERLAIAGLI